MKENNNDSKSKEDITVDTLVAVARHVLHFGNPVVLTKLDGTPEFKITIEEL